MQVGHVSQTLEIAAQTPSLQTQAASLATLAETAHFQLAGIYRKLGRPSDADREMKQFQAIRDRRRR
jgi:hypothetical protein